jgi:hypothetical protein
LSARSIETPNQSRFNLSNVAVTNAEILRDLSPIPTASLTTSSATSFADLLMDKSQSFDFDSMESQASLEDERHLSYFNNSMKDHESQSTVPTYNETAPRMSMWRESEAGGVRSALGKPTEVDLDRLSQPDSDMTVIDLDDDEESNDERHYSNVDSVKSHVELFPLPMAALKKLAGNEEEHVVSVQKEMNARENSQLLSSFTTVVNACTQPKIVETE